MLSPSAEPTIVPMILEVIVWLIKGCESLVDVMLLPLFGESVVDVGYNAVKFVDNLFPGE
jgi:hypothetical protein